MRGEFTLRAVILGAILAVVFGGANAYLGLKAGMTVSASIPAAVISMAILRGIMRRGTILENNIVQTIASAGESLAAGVIFTVPALIFLGMNPGIFLIFLLAAAGGLLGVLLMVPLRKHLIEDEDKTLPFPEGRACAEVLEAGEEGGRKARMVFTGLGIGAVFKFLMSWVRLFEGVPVALIKRLNTLIGFDISPALLGVGYILGLRISSLVVAGGLIGWFVLIPLISGFAHIEVHTVEDVYTIWSKYIRYIGAGAVLGGGVISLIRSTGAFKEAFRGIKGGFKLGGLGRDLPFPVVILGTVVIYLLLILVPHYRLDPVSSFLGILFAFLFVTVSSRLVGIVGSSSNPISGMTIATLLFISLFMVARGSSGSSGMFMALSLGAVVCIAAAIAGDTSQDLKTGYLVGATPWKQQIGEFIGVIVSAIFIGWTLFLLHKAYTLGSKELSAPQATLMSLVVKGVFEGTMPWILIFSGISISIVIELLQVHSLPFAVGLYLPLELSTTIYVGGLINRVLGEKNSGILLASGLVAGDALMGIIIALLIVSKLPPLQVFHPTSVSGFLAFIALIAVFGGLIKKEKS